MRMTLKERLKKSQYRFRHADIALDAGLTETDFSKIVNGKFVPAEEEMATKIALAVSHAMRETLTPADIWPGRGFEGASE